MRRGPDVEQLFAKHARDVLAYALRRTDSATAEDVVAEVFAVAWRRRGRIPAEEPVLWLYAVARRILANERRGTQRRAALASALADRSARDPIAAAGDEEAAIVAALGRLPPGDREVLMLSSWEGLSAGQVAVVLGCNAGAIHTRLHRARRRLAVELQADDIRAVVVRAQPTEGRTG